MSRLDHLSPSLLTIEEKRRQQRTPRSRIYEAGHYSGEIKETRPCMCCGADFRSAGNHNRLCAHCRTKG
jgi:hypothetical protein